MPEVQSENNDGLRPIKPEPGIERDGKYVYATLAVNGKVVVKERVPLHVWHMEREKQAWHLKLVVPKLFKKLKRALRP